MLVRDAVEILKNAGFNAAPCHWYAGLINVFDTAADGAVIRTLRLRAGDVSSFLKGA